MKVNSAKQSVVVKPGQMWTWSFEVGDGSWLVEAVSEAKRHRWTAQGHVVLIKRGDTFTVIATDDSGPQEVPLIGVPRPQLLFDELRDSIIETPTLSAKKRWHVAILKGALVWINHDFFNHAELLEDA